MGFGVSGLEIGVSGSGFLLSGFKCRVPALGQRAGGLLHLLSQVLRHPPRALYLLQGLGLRVEREGLRV